MPSKKRTPPTEPVLVNPIEETIKWFRENRKDFAPEHQRSLELMLTNQHEPKFQAIQLMVCGAFVAGRQFQKANPEAI